MTIVVSIIFGAYPLFDIAYNIFMGNLDTREWFQPVYVVYGHIFNIFAFNSVSVWQTIFISNKFYLFFHFSIPYYQHTIPEHILYNSVMYFLSIAYVMTMTVLPAVTFFINCHLLAEVKGSHFKIILTEVDQMATQYNKCTMMAMKKNLVDAISVHIELTR